MHGCRRRGRERTILVSAVDDSFNYGKPATRREGLDPRALTHGLLASALVLLGYLALKLI